MEDNLSNCCWIPVYEGSDFCSACNEHCQVMTICPDCEGTGERKVMDMDTVNNRSSSYPEDTTVTCPICNGEGYC